MIINSRDILIDNGVQAHTSISITGPKINLSLKFEDNRDPGCTAISFLHGDVLSDDPFVVTLDKSTVFETKVDSWDINTVNAFQMMRIAHIISGGGEGEYLDIVRKFHDESPEAYQNILTPIGDSCYSRYIVKGLCIFAMNHSNMRSEMHAELSKIKNDFEREAFSVSGKLTQDQRALVAKARSLSKRSDNIV